MIPRAHAFGLLDIEDADLVAVTRLVREVSAALVGALGAHGVNVLHASGTAAEQSVLHLHFHVVPRWKADGFTT